MKEVVKYAEVTNRVLLGLVMLIPGLLKLFVMTPAAVTGMLAGFGIPAAGFFTWVLIVVEIVAGIAILAKWQLKWVVWGPVIILVVAAFTAHKGNYSNMIVHVALASSFWLLGVRE